MTPTTLDLTAVVQPLLAVAGLVIAGYIAKYLGRLLEVANAHFHLNLTDQQIAAFTAAVQTAAGVVETMIDQKAMSVAHVTVTNDGIRAQAQAIVDAAPEAAAMLNLTEAGVAKMIVGAVDTGSRTPAPVASSVVTNVTAASDVPAAVANATPVAPAPSVPASAGG